MQLLLHTLRAEADMLQRAAAVGTALRCGLGKAAVVAHEPVVGAVVRQVHTAAGAFRHIAALGAQQLAAAAPAVQEQDALLPRRHVFLQLVIQRLADDGAAALPQLMAQVRHDDPGQRLPVEPLPQLQQTVVALFRVPGRLHRGGGGAQQQPRALLGAAVLGHVPGMVAGCVLGLVRALLFLIHDDETQLRQRREHRRARAQHDTGLAPADALVLIVPLRHAQATVQQGHPVAEIGGKAGHHLRRQGDLRDEDHYGLAPFQQQLGQPDIHHGLAAAGNAQQQRDAGLTPVYLRQQRVADTLLLVVQCNICRLYSVLFFRDAVFLLLAQGYRAQPAQVVHGLFRRAGKIPQVVKGRFAVPGQKRHHFPAFGGPARQICGLLRRYAEGREGHHLVADLFLLLCGVGQRSRLLHATQQRRYIVAQGLTQLVLRQRAVLQKPGHRLLPFRGVRHQHRLAQRPDLPVAIPHGGGQDGAQRVVEGAEIPAAHPQGQPQLLLRHHRLVVQQRTDGLQRLGRHFLMQRQDHTLTEPVAASKGDQHAASHPARQLIGQQIVIRLVDGIRRRLHGQLGDNGHLSSRLPR